MDVPRFERSSTETDSGQLMETPEKSVQARLPRGKLRWLAIGSALLLVLLITLAGLLVIMKASSTVDQVVIVTVPSGADITFDSTPLGLSPIKLEGVSVGVHKLVIIKEGYEPDGGDLNVVGPETFDYRLKPAENAGLPLEEQVRRYTAGAEECFQRGDYYVPSENNALYYADKILHLDPSNQFASGLRESVRKVLYRLAQGASSFGDFAGAQEYYEALVNHYPDDSVAKAASLKIESQLVGKRGEVRDLLRRADESFRAGNYTEPDGDSAFYYAKQALARDHHNSEAKLVLERVRGQLINSGTAAVAKGDSDSALSFFEQAVRKFPGDKEVAARIRELGLERSTEDVKANSPTARRERGLEKYSRGEYGEAINDLKYASENGESSADVISALGRSYLKLRQFGFAAHYLSRVPESAGDAYRSALAMLGEIAQDQGDTAKALSYYKQALSRGGSTVYSEADIEERIAKIEARQQIAKSPEPAGVSIKVKHLHGGLLKGSCSGVLAVSSTGVRFDGSEHTYSSNLMAAGVRISGGDMSVKFQDKSEKFKASQTDGDRFQNALSRLQAAGSTDK